MNSNDDLRARSVLFHPFRDKKFGQSTCFLCGVDIDSIHRSDEHVFPRWMQERYRLWDQSIDLLNGTSIQYRQLTIPCCRTCNNEYLSPIERRVGRALEGGAEELRKLGPKTLLLWLGKIFYGLLYKELLLPLDQRDQKEGPIVSSELLEEYKMLHFFLQSARVPIRFEKFFPASIFVFDTQAPNDIRGQFDFRDSLQTLTISIRLGHVGIIAALQDGGAQGELLTDELERFYALSLHPLQFTELTAQFFYKATLFNRVPKYVAIETEGSASVFQLPLGGLSSKRVFDPDDRRDYAKVLSQFTGYPMDQIFRPPDKVATWLVNEKDQLHVLNLNDLSLRI